MNGLGRTLLPVLAMIAGVIAPSIPAGAEDSFIIVQSTTSTQNSGLLDYLIPKFKTASGIEVRVVAVGTGQAIRNAMNGDGDVLLVHAKAAEEKFVTDGHGIKRDDLMYNDFVIVGPGKDPAGIDGMKDVTAALKKVAEVEAKFASRGDDSGTHKKEVSLWRAASLDPAKDSGGWYRETGSGMGATLNTAIGMSAYTITDRATWISFRNKADFKVVVEGDARLFNQYGVILVNPKRHPGIRAKAGQRFIDWLLSTAGQNAIGGYKVDGKQLFFPNATAGG